MAGTVGTTTQEVMYAATRHRPLGRPRRPSPGRSPRRQRRPRDRALRRRALGAATAAAMHRGALLADGSISGDDLLCGVHGWDYGFRTGISSYNNDERLAEVHLVGRGRPGDGRPRRDRRLGASNTRSRTTATRTRAPTRTRTAHPTSRTSAMIRELAANGLSKVGHHGAVTSMGVPARPAAELGLDPDRHRPAGAPPAARRRRRSAPMSRSARGADKPLQLDIPLFVSDMSFGALSQEAKIGARTWRRGRRHRHLLRRGRHAARGAGTRTRATSTSWRRAASAGRSTRSRDVQAFHFKFGQGAKTGTGGHLPGNKVVGRIAEVRGLDEGTPAVSPATFPDLAHRSTTSASSPARCAMPPAGSRSGPSCRPSTSRPTSTQRSRSASTT